MRASGTATPAGFVARFLFQASVSPWSGPGGVVAVCRSAAYAWACQWACEVSINTGLSRVPERAWRSARRPQWGGIVCRGGTADKAGREQLKIRRVQVHADGSYVALAHVASDFFVAAVVPQQDDGGQAGFDCT